MKYNGYNDRRRARYYKETSPPVAQRLIEQFIVQLMICAIALTVLFGAHFFKFKPMQQSIEKIKFAVTYSTSWNEIIKDAREATSVIINRMRPSQVEEVVPIISIDDEANEEDKETIEIQSIDSTEEN